MSTLYWEEEIETLPRVGLESIQLRRLQHLVARVYKTVRPYREKMKEAGVLPEDIKNLSDLQKLPFTVKDDLRDNYPFGLFTVPLDEVVRVHASSGTTGKPTVVGYTWRDIELWASVMARALTCASECTWQDWSCGASLNSCYRVWIQLSSRENLLTCRQILSVA